VRDDFGRVLVYGLAETGDAVARALIARGHTVVLADDVVTDDRRAAAAALGLELADPPRDDAAIAALVERVDVVVPSPGVPEEHRLIDAARLAERPILSELDLAWTWEQQRPGGPRPMLAITGTDGKTTASLMATAMANASGRRAMHAANDGEPLVAAIDHDDVELFVVECSSFRLAWAERFAPSTATWLNLGHDHLNWHKSLASYADAKSRVWEHQSTDDVAIGNGDDPMVMAYLHRAPARQVTFGATGDYRVEDDQLIGPEGPFAAMAALTRRLPHDTTNALAAAATVLEAGAATSGGVARALSEFQHPPHRIEFVAELDGVAWYDDSKATTPHAAVTAMRGFNRVVLVAGGKNKGLDLTELTAAHQHVKAVVAIGAAADDVAAAFEGHCAVEVVGGLPPRMDQVVRTARSLADPGDVVLLSPGCASYDWYRSFGERGDDFAHEVRALLDESEEE
jgi:UDP-N-acetylmuramoylalanine--D-glutamate ligase